MNDNNWTPWLKNSGTGECPVPDWAKQYQVDLGDGVKADGTKDADKWQWRQQNVAMPITHYKYKVPEDLAWLAKTCSDMSGALYISQNGIGSYDLTSRPFNTGDSYTHTQWLRTRQDFGLMDDTASPSWADAPEWAEWLAQEPGGMWTWYEEKPVAKGTFWDIAEITDKWQDLPRAMRHSPNKDWRKTLQRRPQPAVTPEEDEAWREREAQGVSDGSTASYYELPEGATQLQDLISYRNLNAQDGEIFRAIYRKGLASHSDALRDAKKVLFYARAEVDRLEALK